MGYFVSYGTYRLGRFTADRLFSADVRKFFKRTKKTDKAARVLTGTKRLEEIRLKFKRGA